MQPHLTTQEVCRREICHLDFTDPHPPPSVFQQPRVLEWNGAWPWFRADMGSRLSRACMQSPGREVKAWREGLIKPATQFWHWVRRHNGRMLLPTLAAKVTQQVPAALHPLALDLCGSKCNCLGSLTSLPTPGRRISTDYHRPGALLLSNGTIFQSLDPADPFSLSFLRALPASISL